MKNITKFLKECRVNGNEKIDTNDDSFWKLKDLLEHYKEQCNIPVVVERYLFEGRDLTNNQSFKKVIDAKNRESAIADMEVTYPHLKWVMTTKV